MTTNGTEPVRLDLDAARAARAEAGRETFSFVFGGERFEVLAVNDWPLEAQGDLAEGALTRALPLVLVGGSETYHRFFTHEPTMGDVMTLFDAISRWAGLGGLPNFSQPRLPVSNQT